MCPSPLQCCVYCAKLFQRQEHPTLDSMSDYQQDTHLPRCQACAGPILGYTANAEGLTTCAWICRSRSLY